MLCQIGQSINIASALHRLLSASLAVPYVRKTFSILLVRLGFWKAVTGPKPEHPSITFDVRASRMMSNFAR